MTAGTSPNAGPAGPAALDRVAGALVGLAAGDALGAGYEFEQPPAGPAEMMGGGLGDWDRGEWTDDTQMAICVAEVLATGTIDVAAIGDRFLAWLAQRPADFGVQTRAVLGAARTGAELPTIAASHFERNPRGSAGNGSLMRTGPVALAALGDDARIVEAARDISMLTHADPLALDACVLWSIAIDRAVRESRLDGAWDGLDYLGADARSAWAARLGEARQRPPSTFTPNGFVVTALQAALASIVQTPVPDTDPCTHLQAALHTAVGIGHDTDTVAAIAGSLLGARWGASAVPFRWRRLLHGWPGYDVRDLVRLAVLASRGGKDDQEGWPSVASMTGHYTDSYGLQPLAEPVAEGSRVLLGNAADVAASTADAIVSLCRMGRHEATGAEVHDVWLIDASDPAANPNLTFVLRDAAEAIATLEGEGKSVLVHCVAAESRTPAVGAAYLAHRDGISGTDALLRIARVLPGAIVRPVFADAIRECWPER